MLPNSTNEPCLVQARQGFSVLYQNHFLYSKYNPIDSIQKIINATDIKEETLILAFSPLLGYGIKELRGKMPKNCFLLAIEIDKNLYDFSVTEKESFLCGVNGENVTSHENGTACTNGENGTSHENGENVTSHENGTACTNGENNFLYKYIRNESELALLLNDESFCLGKYRRCLPINFSASVSFYKAEYDYLLAVADNAISTFWKNRTTLIKLGRLYSANFFKNIADIVKQKKYSFIQKNALEMPILVLGAGPSLSAFLEKSSVEKLTSSNINALCKKFFILAVDAALPVLQSFGIRPDCVVGVEGQHAIEKVYIGSGKSSIPLFADLCSRPNIKKILQSNAINFFSEFTNASFVSDFKKVASKINAPVLPALGSVGLSAVELALHLRKNDVPIFVLGMDFAYNVGLTHSKGSSPHIALLNVTNKLHPLENNVGSAFKQNNVKFIGKSGFEEITDTALKNYAQMFVARYKNVKALFDLAESGIDKGLQAPFSSVSDFWGFVDSLLVSDCKKSFYATSDDDKTISELKEFLNGENCALKEIKDILTGKTSTTVQDMSETMRDTRLETLLKNRGYLYLHFPDAARGLDLSPHFLKRIRSELDYFIKLTTLD